MDCKALLANYRTGGNPIGSLCVFGPLAPLGIRGIGPFSCAPQRLSIVSVLSEGMSHFRRVFSVGSPHLGCVTIDHSAANSVVPMRHFLRQAPFGR